MSFSRFLCLGTLFASSFVSAASGQPSPPTHADPVLLTIMQQELNRAMSSLSKSDPAPYFISYETTEEFSSIIFGSNGALMGTLARHERSADITVRLGSRELDNTHGENRFNAVATASLPLEDKPDAIQRVLWLNTDRMYKKASQSFLEVKTTTKVQADEEDSSADFSVEKPQVFIGKAALPPNFDQHEWEEK